MFTSTRDVAKFVFSSENNNLLHFGGRKPSKEMSGGNNVSYVAPDLHRKLRRLVGEPVSGDNLKKNFERIETICLEILNGWSGKTVSAIDGTSSVSNLDSTLDSIIAWVYQYKAFCVVHLIDLLELLGLCFLY